MKSIQQADVCWLRCEPAARSFPYTVSWLSGSGGQGEFVMGLLFCQPFWNPSGSESLSWILHFHTISSKDSAWLLFLTESVTKKLQWLMSLRLWNVTKGSFVLFFVIFWTQRMDCSRTFPSLKPDIKWPLTSKGDKNWKRTIIKMLLSSHFALEAETDMQIIPFRKVVTYFPKVCECSGLWDSRR